MRVVLIHHAAPPVVGGVERVLGHHARLIARAGHEVTVVAGRGAIAGRRITMAPQPLVDSLHPEIAAMSASLAAGRVPSSFAPLVRRLEAALAPHLDSADVVIAHNVASLNKNLALTAALHRRSQAGPRPRFVLWHHDLAWALPHYRPTLHDGDPWDLLRTAWPGVHQVVISGQRRRELAELTGLAEASIEVVPNGVDVPVMLAFDRRTITLLRTSPIRDADPLLLMPARILPRKNIELGVRVVAALVARGRPAGLVVTGPMDPHDTDEAGYAGAIRSLMTECGVADRVWLPGADTDRGVPDQVVADLYAMADLLFLPSREEGFGIPVLEALLHRLPIVCSDLAVLREVAGDAASYIDPDGDPDAIAAAVLARLDEDPVAVAAGRVRRERSWDAIDRGWLRPLLERLAAGVTAPRGDGATG